MQRQCCQSLYQNFVGGLGREPQSVSTKGKNGGARGGGGCDPTSLKLDGLHYSNASIVCNVNNNPKLLLIERKGWATGYIIK